MNTKVMTLLLAVILVLTVVNIFGTFKLAGRVNDITGGVVIDEPADEPADEPEELEVADVSVDDDEVQGEADAPVTIIEFSDYECPFCGRFISQTYSQIKEKYIETGKAKYVFRDFPLSFHANAQKAAEASECAGEQGKFWEYHDELFANQNSLDVASLKKYAEDLGLDTDAFNKCLDDGEMKAEVEKDMAEAAAAGVRGTPTLFINGKKIVGAQPFKVFEAAIEAELAE